MRRGSNVGAKRWARARPELDGSWAGARMRTPNWAPGRGLLQCSGAERESPATCGPIAQRKSAPFTPERSLVRTQLGPPPDEPRSPSTGARGFVISSSLPVRDSCRAPSPPPGLAASRFERALDERRGLVIKAASFGNLAETVQPQRSFRAAAQGPRRGSSS